MSVPEPTVTSVRIVPLTQELWEAGGRAAYQAGIDTGHASFAAAATPWEEFVTGKPSEHLLAAVQVHGDAGAAADGPGTSGALAGSIATPACLGWASVAPAFSRCVYAGVLEVSVYVDPMAAGRGVGEALLRALIASTEAGGVWTLEALIFPENEGSLRLHRRLGFREVGVRERLGLMTHGPLAGQWRDVVLLERRSPRVGVNV